MAKAKNINNKEEPIEKQLWKAPDKLRKNIDATEYKHIVLGLPDYEEDFNFNLLEKQGYQYIYDHGIVSDVGAGSKPALSESVLSEKIRVGLKPAPTNKLRDHTVGLPEIVRQFKTFSSRRINQIRKTPGTPVWQRNYYEHIIRNDEELFSIQKYIRNNPMNWESDEEYQAAGEGSKLAIFQKNADEIRAGLEPAPTEEY